MSSTMRTLCLGTLLASVGAVGPASATDSTQQTTQQTQQNSCVTQQQMPNVLIVSAPLNSTSEQDIRLFLLQIDNIPLNSQGDVDYEALADVGALQQAYSAQFQMQSLPNQVLAELTGTQHNSWYAYYGSAPYFNFYGAGPGLNFYYDTFDSRFGLFYNGSAYPFRPTYFSRPYGNYMNYYYMY